MSEPDLKAPLIVRIDVRALSVPEVTNLANEFRMWRVELQKDMVNQGHVLLSGTTGAVNTALRCGRELLGSRLLTAAIGDPITPRAKTALEELLG